MSVNERERYLVTNFSTSTSHIPSIELGAAPPIHIMSRTETDRTKRDRMCVCVCVRKRESVCVR